MRRVFFGVFQDQGDLDGIRGYMTTAELTSKFAIHAKQVAPWKSQLLDQATDLFEDDRRKRGEGCLAEEEELYKRSAR